MLFLRLFKIMIRIRLAVRQLKGHKDADFDRSFNYVRS